MNTATLQIAVPLSQLVPGPRNPRKVKPGRDAHHRLVALIRSQGLLQPLVVRQIGRKQFEVVAGSRRLRALREIHKNDGNPRIPCVLRNVEQEVADALSLGENFGREPMHPLDEAEAFAKLASVEGKDAEVIAAEFGVTERYVRQRMKLATLAAPVKAAYRNGQIDTAIAEAFAAVPEDRQLEVWKESNGQPRHADHVRNIIAHAWIDAQHAQFDLAKLPESAVSRDLFGDRVLVERQAFMQAQTESLEAQRQTLSDEGWNEVVIARREDVQDRLYAMAVPQREFDEQTSRKLAKIESRKQKLDESAEQFQEGDDAARQRLQSRYEALEEEEQKIVEAAPETYSEVTKATATSFLILDPDGRAHREIRVPRRTQQRSANGNGHADGDASETPKAPTADDLSDNQLAVTFTHQAIAVREAVLGNVPVRKRVLALILHEKVRAEALSIRHEANGTTLHATGGSLPSGTFERLQQKRAKLDPFGSEPFIEEREAYERVSQLSASKLDGLIDLLVVDCLAAHPLRPTALVHQLAAELKIDVRQHWRPDAAWLSGYKKIQLADLIVQLNGSVHAPAPDRKKSELVEMLDKLFTDAAEGRLEDKALTERVNRWLPSNLRDTAANTEEVQHV